MAIMHNELPESKGELHHQDDYAPGMQTPGDRLRYARVKAGYDTAKSAAEAMGVTVSTYIQHENGGRGLPASRADRYASFFRVAPEWLLYGRGDAPKQTAPSMSGLRHIDRRVPVIGVVQAGIWQDVSEVEGEPEEFLAVSLQGFERAQLYGLRVVGPSMNLIYPEGTRLVICPTAEIGLRAGHHVVVRRRRASMVETTLKEVVQAKGGIELWPRSSDPRYQEPIRYERRHDADEGIEIIGVVVAHYYVLPQPNRPLIQF